MCQQKCGRPERRSILFCEEGENSSCEEITGKGGISQKVVVLRYRSDREVQTLTILCILGAGGTLRLNAKKSNNRSTSASAGELVMMSV